MCLAVIQIRFLLSFFSFKLILGYLLMILGKKIFRDIMVTGILNSPRISAGLSFAIVFRK